MPQLVEKDMGIVQYLQKVKINYFVQNVPPERFGDNICKRRTKGRRSCSPPLEMLSHFSPHFSARNECCAGSFAVSPNASGNAFGRLAQGWRACGRRRGLCPRPASIFEKLLDQKTFIDLAFCKTETAAVFMRQSIIKYHFHLTLYCISHEEYPCRRPQNHILQAQE